MRECEVNVLIGTTGTGKTTAIKEMIKTQKRALIFPANNFDPAWSEFETIVPKRAWVPDQTDFKKKRKKPVYRIKELHEFTGIRVVDLSNVSTHEDRMSLRDSVISINGFIDGAIVFDDFKNWIYTKGTVPGVVRSMLGDIRHKRTDLFFATHALNEINADLVPFIHNIYLFRSTLPPNATFAKKMGDRYDALMETYNRVNKIAATDDKHYVEEFKIR